MRALILVLGTAGLAETMARHPGLVDARSVVKELQVELKYATKDNFMGRAVYGDLTTCFLQKDAAAMLARAQQALVAAHPELRLRVYDCARPAWVQRIMWDIVKGTPQAPYVADPAKGSIHSFGCAVDLTVATREGKPLDMGSPFDHFGDDGTLSPEAAANRLLLQEVMLRAGFRMLPHEWWHFDCAAHADTRKRYKIIP